jgi:hypothetical protein
MLENFSSGALVKFGEELLMYRRDNKPEIPHPNKLALFGGGSVYSTWL